MKFLILIAIMVNTYAAILEGEVQGLEVPLYDLPSSNSEVVQYVRKGDVIKVHGIHDIDLQRDLGLIDSSDLYSNDELEMQVSKFNNAISDTEFYKTFDNNGNDAYIPKKYVKIIFNDSREFSDPVSKYSPDDSDYRLQEPLKEKYPYYQDSGYRASFNFLLSDTTKDNYNYQSSISTAEYRSRYGAKIILAYNVKGDVSDRFFFGGQADISYKSNNFELSDGQQAREQNVRAGLGPIVIYDFAKFPKNVVSFFGSLLLNPLDQYYVTVDGDSGKESATFSGTTITSEFGLQYSRKDIAPDLDFAFGSSLKYQVFGNLKASDITGDSNNLSTSEDTYERSQVPEWNLFAGLQIDF